MAIFSNSEGLRISDPPNILNRTKWAISTDSEGLRISDPQDLKQNKIGYFLRF